MPETAETVMPSTPTTTPSTASPSPSASSSSRSPATLPDLEAVGTVSIPDPFPPRHLGPDSAQTDAMLKALGLSSLDDLTERAIPDAIRLPEPMRLSTFDGVHPGAMGETEALASLRAIAQRNEVFRSFIGMGYHDCIVPGVIQRNVLENPGWYTQYTPYQAEISQGRLEALINFQTMISDLTGLPLAGASLLDESTAAAEAMSMCLNIVAANPATKGRTKFLVADDCHPQTIAVVQTRAEAIGVIVEVVAAERIEADDSVFGALLQYPGTDGVVRDLRPLIAKLEAVGAKTVVAADLLSLTILTPPGEMGAEIVVGSSQRFGVPMGFGGPHAAFLATKTEHARRLPGRLIGVSRDAHGNPAFRMAIQTREQHIKRDRATSNICTAQVLLAIMAGFYAVWHGPRGLRRIGQRIHRLTSALAGALDELGHSSVDARRFDTLTVTPGTIASGEHLDAERIHDAATNRRLNFRRRTDGRIGISLDEATTVAELARILECFGADPMRAGELAQRHVADASTDLGDLGRTSDYLTHPVFNSHQSETDLLRYITRLQQRDLSLAHSMIPLGSCTMKLNATSEMLPVTWPEFGALHPFAPSSQTAGYAELFRQLETWLAEITGFAAVSLQPNAGSQGEYAGLLVIRAYHHARGDTQRDVCLIPVSAHGTNPASAVMAGMRVVPIVCDERGDIDIEDLRKKAAEHADRLAALMVTYPSTHGVFERGIRDVCEVVHEHGGQVYMDGANMNAQVGLTSPGFIGADVCHLNLHKTFCIPHGGGGPGMGPIGVAEHLKAFLPTHPVTAPATAGEMAIGPIAAAPYGSPSILPISWMYIAMMGAEGLLRATQLSILNANHMARRLREHFDLVYTSETGLVAHEFIVDCRAFDKSADIKIDDIAKRLMDYGFHAPTMAWPVPGTLMIEPTESESMEELDRLCDALIAIREEIAEIEAGKLSRSDNPLKHAPHTVAAVTADEWTHPYSRQTAAFPAEWVKHGKFWPFVGRVDNPYGDRNLVCTCPSVEEAAE